MSMLILISEGRISRCPVHLRGARLALQIHFLMKTHTVSILLVINQ